MEPKDFKNCPSCGCTAFDLQGTNYSEIVFTCGTKLYVDGSIVKTMRCVSNSVISDLAKISIVIDDALQGRGSTKQLAQSIEPLLQSIKNRCLIDQG